MKYLFFSLIFAFSALAHENDVTHRPQSFSYLNGKAVFVDMEEAIYNITYDLDQKKAEVVAQIKLNIVEEGYPIFDLVQDPTLVQIDGKEVTAQVVTTPSRETQLRVINQSLKVGQYDLTIKTPLTNLIEFTNTGVKSAFWVTDLDDRYYLERYIPVNLEYDRVKMIFNLNFKGMKSEQHVFANGEVKKISESKYTIEYPEYFTMNSLYFHTTPMGSVKFIQNTLKSVNGRDIPVVIYQSPEDADNTLEAMNTITLRVFNELERDYGAFPHPSITIYNASLAHMGLGGMEYAGATVTNRGSLSHELFHSYFARGIVPANGNAGWIDESLASWRDDGYRQISILSGTSSMAAHAPYTRKTDTDAYSFGSRFMSFLNYKFANKGGLKPFMNKLLETKLFEPIFTEDFISEMEAFYGEKLGPVFNKYVYGKSLESMNKSPLNPIHRKMTMKELAQIL